MDSGLLILMGLLSYFIMPVLLVPTVKWLCILHYRRKYLALHGRFTKEDFEWFNPRGCLATNIFCWDTEVFYLTCWPLFVVGYFLVLLWRLLVKIYNILNLTKLLMRIDSKIKKWFYVEQRDPNNHHSTGIYR